MSPAKLRKECLSDPDKSLIVTCTLDGELVGHACITKWRYQQGVRINLPYRRR